MTSRATRELRGDQESNASEQARKVAAHEARQKAADEARMRSPVRVAAPKRAAPPAAPAKKDPFSIFGAGKIVGARGRQIDREVDKASK